MNPSSPPLITLDAALRLDARQNKANHRRHLNPRLAVLLEFIGAGHPVARASGAHYWDAAGNRYLDFLSAFGALPFGHNPPAIQDAVARVRETPNLVEGLSLVAGALAHNLSALAPPGLSRVFFANAGTEVVDTAVKLARAATGRSRMVACLGGFHGRSLGALSLMDRAEHHAAFDPLQRDVSFVPFGDADALDAVLSRRDAAAFVVEPVQGEAGMIDPPPGYLATARSLCARYGTLFVADEVQTGLCRTGRMFALDREQVVPDVLLLGKALGGGVMPLSALLTTDKLFRAAQGGTPYSPFHESTYAGNTWACAAGMATLEMLTTERAEARATEAGAYLLAGVKALQRVHPAIRAVRGVGLMIGVELAPPIAGGVSRATAAVLGHVRPGYFTGMLIRELLVKHRIMTAYTLNNPDVLRLQPPLTVTRDQMDEVVGALDESLTRTRHLAPAAARTITALTKAQFTVMRPGPLTRSRP